MSRAFIGDALKLVASRLSCNIIAVLTGIVVARTLGASGKGSVTSIMLVAVLVQSICELGVRQSAVICLASGKYDARTVIGTVYSLFCILGLLGFAVSLYLLLQQGPIQPSTTLAVVASLIVPASMFLSYSQGILASKNQISKISHIYWVPAVAALLLTTVFVAVLQFGVLGAVLATLLAAVPMIIYSAHAVRAIGPVCLLINSSCLRDLVKKGLSYSVALFAIMLQYRVGIVLLQNSSDLAQIGLFSLGLNFAEAIWQVPSALGLLIFSKSANAQNRDEFSLAVATMLRRSLWACIPIALLVGISASAIVPLIYGASFANSVEVLRVMLPGVVVMIYFKVLNMDLAGRGRPLTSLIAVLPGLALNAALAHWLVPTHGAIGAGIAASFGFTLTGILTAVVFCRLSGLNLKQLWFPCRDDIDWFRKLLRFPAFR